MVLYFGGNKMSWDIVCCILVGGACMHCNQGNKQKTHKPPDLFCLVSPHALGLREIQSWKQ